VAFRIDSVRLANNEAAPVRCYHESYGSSNASSNSLPSLASGKDVTVTEGTEFTALVDGDVHLKRETFIEPQAAPTLTGPSAQNSPDQR
jgi:hypothetical protein